MKRAGHALLLAAIVLFVLSCAGFWWLARNPFPLILSLPVLAYLLFYSYTKRFTRWSHFVLGSAIALSPPAAWLAIHPASFGWPVLILTASVTLWIGGFDIIYACQDIDFDRREGLYSAPARYGPRRALRLSSICHALTTLLLIALGLMMNLGWVYALGVLLTAGLLAYEHHLVRPDDFSRLDTAFFNINSVISVCLFASTLIALWIA